MIEAGKLHLEPIKPDNNKRRSVPIASVGHNRIDFNKEASNQLSLSNNHRYVEVYHGEQNNKMIILFKFINTRTPNAFKLSVFKDKRVSVCDKSLTNSIFGASASGKVRRYDDIEIDQKNKLIQISL